MPSLRELFPRRYLSMHDFRPNEQALVTIRAVVLEEVRARPRGFGQPAEPPEPKWLLYFHEYAKPMVLRPGRAAKVAAAVGAEKTEDWPGKKIMIYRGITDIAGEAVEGLLINSQPVAQLTAAGPPKLFIAADTRLIPKAAVDRFLANTKQVGGSWDGFLAFCRANCAEAFAALWGLALDAIPAGALPVMKAYLDSIATPASLPSGAPPALAPSAATPAPAASPTTEVIDRATGEVVSGPARPSSPWDKTGRPTPDDLDEMDIPF